MCKMMVALDIRILPATIVPLRAGGSSQPGRAARALRRDRLQQVTVRRQGIPGRARPASPRQPSRPPPPPRPAPPRQLAGSSVPRRRPAAIPPDRHQRKGGAAAPVQSAATIT